MLFRRVGLARQQCLVDEEIPGLEKAPIRQNQISGGKQHDITRNEVLSEHRNFLTVAQDLFFERHRDFEMLGGFLGTVFLHRIERCTHQHNCRNDD